MNVSVLGTGLLGRAVAERLHECGYRITVYNRTKAKTEPLRALGLEVKESATDAMHAAEVVILLLADAVAIRQVLFAEPAKQAIAGRTIIQMGTIGPSESRSLDREVTAAGGAYVEAPVLGSIAEAKDGTLLVMVGATPTQFEQWQPLFRALGSSPRLIGPVGKAAALKLALNQLIAAEIAAFSLSLGLIQRSGVDVDTFMEILRASALFAPTFEKKLPRLLARNYANPNFSTRHLLKDLDLVSAEAELLSLRTSSLDGVRPLLQAAIAKGLGNADYSSLFSVVHPERPSLERR